MFNLNELLNTPEPGSMAVINYSQPAPTNDNGKEASIQRLQDWRQAPKFKQRGNDLSWNVSKTPIFLDGVETGFSAIRRDDTGHVFQMAKAYEIMQNWELLQLCEISAGEANLQLSNVGYLGAGELVFIQATTGNTMIGDSPINKFVTVLNSHDGSTAVKWGLSNVNVVCENTFAAAYKQVANAAKHTANMKDRIKGMLNAFNQAKIAETTLYDDLARLVDTPLSKNAIFSTIEKVFDVKRDEINDASTRTKNQIQELHQSIELEIGRQGQNLWGLFNGVTHFTTHKASSDKDANAKSKMTGLGQRRDNDVLQQLLRLVPVSTQHTVKEPLKTMYAAN